jgi:hypothetical protein
MPLPVSLKAGYYGCYRKGIRHPHPANFTLLPANGY